MLKLVRISSDKSYSWNINRTLIVFSRQFSDRNCNMDPLYCTFEQKLLIKEAFIWKV